MTDILYFPEWKKYKVDAGVTTKLFPVHFQKTSDLDLKANQKKLEEAFQQSPVTRSKKISFSGCFAYLHQVHEGKVAVLEDKQVYRQSGFYRFPETDGVISNIPGLTLLAMTADCLSVFFHAPGWVGIVHAGWRGTQKQIISTAVKLLIQKAQCAPSKIHAIFGPSICGRHYEVGEEFKKYFSKPALQHRKDKYYFDLVEENKQQIRILGVPIRNISESKLCTVSENKHFHSFRLEKESAGRMISFIQFHP